jgi:hypothetical protein
VQLHAGSASEQEQDARNLAFEDSLQLGAGTFNLDTGVSFSMLKC